MNGPPIAVDTSSAIPFYVQLESLLFDRIESGEWPPGTRIPSEAELCEQYGVSRVTIRQALARLVDRGLLDRQRARGTFVRDSRISANARYATSFTNELNARGMTVSSRILSIRDVIAPPEIASELGCQPGTPLTEIKRVRTGDGNPIGIQTSRLLAELVPGIADHLDDTQSLYAVLRSRYGIQPVEAAEVFRASRVTGADAKLLGVPTGSPAFDALRITFDGKRAFEYTTSILRGDRYEIRLALRNP